jgi:N,N'-diacetylchitobiose transport system permease protein
MTTSTAPNVPIPEAQQPAPQRPNRQRKLASPAPWFLLAPSGIVLLAVTVAPIFFLVYTSFTDYSQRTLFTGVYHVVGLSQYSDILADPDFWASVVRTLLFTAAMVIGSVVIGTAVAQLMTRLGTAMRYVVTIALIFAWAMPTVASSMVWKWLFQPGYGVVNWLLTQLRVFGDMTNTDWANNAALAYLSIWLLIVWQAVPFIALTLYAALTQIPHELHEAARIDGAGEWRVWRAVTLPFLAPTLLLVTILSVIWDFNVFNQIWLVSQGGPDGATSTLGVYAYKVAFVSFKVGQGASISVITTILLIGLTAIYVRNLIRSGEDL